MNDLELRFDVTPPRWLRFAGPAIVLTALFLGRVRSANLWGSWIAAGTKIEARKNVVDACERPF